MNGLDEATEQRLYSALSKENQQLVDRGELALYPSRDENKPVIRWTSKNEQGKTAGALAPGSGVGPNHVDKVNGARNTGIKNTRAYRDLMEVLLPADADPNKRGSVGWIIDQALTAAEGHDVVVECPSCEHKFVAYRKQDASILKELLHQTVGTAAKQVEHTGQTENIVRVMDERASYADLQVIEVFAQDPEEAERRRKAVEELRKQEAGAGPVVEGEFKELTEGETDAGE